MSKHDYSTWDAQDAQGSTKVAPRHQVPRFHCAPQWRLHFASSADWGSASSKAQRVRSVKKSW